MPGQVRIRVRFRKYTTPWFDYLMVTKDEMKAILRGTGWRVETYIDSEEADDLYVAVLEKEKSGS